MPHCNIPGEHGLEHLDRHEVSDDDRRIVLSVVRFDGSPTITTARQVPSEKCTKNAADEAAAPGPRTLQSTNIVTCDAFTCRFPEHERRLARPPMARRAATTTIGTGPSSAQDVLTSPPDAVTGRASVGAMSKAEHGEPVELLADGRPVPITNPSKVLFPELGLTKLDLANYYLAVGEPLMRWIRNRPVLLERYPNGVGGKSFFQKRIPESAPDWLTTTTVQTINGTPSRALVISDLAHVLWAANQGVLGLHVWQYTADKPQWSDELRIDLDPSPGQTFDHIREAAMYVRLYFADLGIRSYVKTTGSKGLHIYVRVIDGYDSFAVRGASVTVARELARLHPDLITDQWWKELRDGKVFVDFNQNAPHKNVFGAWGVRARVGAQVSTPFEWDELMDVVPDDLTMVTVPTRLAARGDPWATMNDEPQDIAPLVERFAEDIADGIPDAPWPPVYPKMPNEAPRVQPSRAKKPE